MRGGARDPRRRSCGPGLARQTVYTWQALLDAGGIDALPRSAGQARRGAVDGAAPRHRAQRNSGARVAAAHLATAQKKPQREGRLIVLIDESGLSERLTRVRTCAPKGKSPVIQFHFNWEHGPDPRQLPVRPARGQHQERAGGRVLQGHQVPFQRPLLILWNGAKPHRSHLVRKYGIPPTPTSRWPSCLPTRPSSIRSSTCGVDEASCDGQFLSRRSRRTPDHRAQQAQERPTSTLAHRRMLGPGVALLAAS